jgi:hypothetical protein
MLFGHRMDQLVLGIPFRSRMSGLLFVIFALTGVVARLPHELTTAIVMVEYFKGEDLLQLKEIAESKV